jgi:predicted DNA-binding transcriptional regulator AlpA
MTPRLIRFKDAPKYLAMDRHCFNREVRPYLAEIRFGKQSVAFDKTDLDDWIAERKKQTESRVTPQNIALKLKKTIEKPIQYQLQKNQPCASLEFQKVVTQILENKKTQKNK